jgi:hypothetical protein
MWLWQVSNSQMLEFPKGLWHDLADLALPKFLDQKRGHFKGSYVLFRGNTDASRELSCLTAAIECENRRILKLVSSSIGFPKTNGWRKDCDQLPAWLVGPLGPKSWSMFSRRWSSIQGDSPWRILFLHGMTTIINHDSDIINIIAIYNYKLL